MTKCKSVVTKIKMNEYLCGSNICRAFIWSNEVYCPVTFSSLFSFSYAERAKKKMKKKEKKNGKILIRLVHVFREKKEKECKRNILRNIEFSSEMMDLDYYLPCVFIYERKEKRRERKINITPEENMLSMTLC